MLRVHRGERERELSGWQNATNFFLFVVCFFSLSNNIIYIGNPKSYLIRFVVAAKEIKINYIYIHVLRKSKLATI